MAYVNHYPYLESHLFTFMEKVGVLHVDSCRGLISAAGDKCRQYQYQWEKNGIPFQHGAAIYMLTYCAPFSDEVRETGNGFVAPAKWVIDNYPKFKPHLPPI
jgi:hypothetical protein